MPKTLFNQILDDTLVLPAQITLQRKKEMYEYAFDLCLPDYHKGRRTLFAVDNIPTYLYFLIGGEAYSFCFSERHDREMIPFLFSSPCMLIEGRSFYKGLPSRFGIEVGEQATILSLSRTDLGKIEAKYPEMKTGIGLMIKQQSKAFKTWRHELRDLTARQRYTNLKQAFPNLLNRFLKKHIAGHLNITQQSLSRIIKGQE